jgi:hypothetical protein
MTDRNKGLRSKQGGNSDTPHSTHPASPRSVSRSGLLMLLFTGLIAGLSSQARADPPAANHVFTGCTFTTGLNTTAGTLNSVLNISDADRTMLNGDQVQASYIVIYVRQNPNDGQRLDGATATYTGPIICRNATDTISATNEGAVIPGPVDIKGAEEASHLKHRLTGSADPNDNKNRVCHTVASNTDCFTIEKASGGGLQ